MKNGLVITRSPRQDRNDLEFRFRDSSGEIIQITQTLLSAEGSQVRLRINAPKSVEILRSDRFNPHSERANNENR